jgi:hypothetical protein
VAGNTSHSAAYSCVLHARFHGLLTCLMLLMCTLWRVQLSEIVSRTRTIKAAVEAAVSKQFAGRRVNVLGEINNALAASA